MSRTRIQTMPWPGGGSVTGFIPPSTNINVVQGPLGVHTQNTCIDSVGWPVPHALDIQHVRKQGLNPLNGTVLTGGGGFRTWKAYVPTYFWNTPSGHLATVLPSEASDITKALALSNPSAPYVSVPNFVYELKDLPGMLRDIGLFKLRLKKIGDGDGPQTIAAYHLSFTFGWIPLISDLRKMVQFAHYTEKVVKRLNRLYSGEGLHRRIEHGLGSNVANSVNNTVFIESAHGFVFTARQSTETIAKRWATVRWKPTSVPKYPPGSKEMVKLAFGVAFGLNLQPKYLWNAVPWSWLVDWFTNVSDYLSTHSNVIPAQNGPVSLMTHTITTAHFTRTDNITDVVGGDGVWTHETLFRSVGTSGTLTTDLPFLDSRRLSILAALAIQRRLPLS